MTIQEILRGLDTWDEEEEVPADLLLAAVDEKDEIVSDLIRAIEDATKNPGKYIADPDRQLYYWAVYLLTYFQSTEAFEPVLNFFKLNGTEFSPIVSDIIDEDGAMILANLCGGKIEPIIDILHDSSAPEPNRSAAAVALGFLCVAGELEPERVEAEYRRALENLTKDTTWLAMELVNGAADLDLRELAADVTRAHDRGLVSDDDFEFLAEWLHDPDFVPPPPYMHLVQSIDDIVEFFEAKYEEDRIMEKFDPDGEFDDEDDSEEEQGI
jgi:hypothetical protein